jgi:hypothetical protein
VRHGKSLGSFLRPALNSRSLGNFHSDASPDIAIMPEAVINWTLLPLSMVESILTSLPESRFLATSSPLSTISSLHHKIQGHEPKYVEKRLPRLGLQQRLARGLAAARHHKAGRGHGSPQNYSKLPCRSRERHELTFSTGHNPPPNRREPAPSSPDDRFRRVERSRPT